MAVPAETTSSKLTGKYFLNKSLSDDTDNILALQGVSWMTRKAIALATLYVTLTHTAEEGEVELLVNHQELTGGLGSSTETRPLDWREREVSDKLFGDIITKTRRAKAPDLEHDYLKEGWTEHSLEYGVINTVGHSDTPKSGMTWVAEQIFDVQEVNGERRFVKRIFFTGPKGEEVTARQVFDYMGPV
ncbi:hypothetical protein BDY19DRAFT_42313 [Irpex rosettiformis]|uniref:Uncharacterized protein n=1 Tax=Irpex rosettiformis TaxID=378272 RepID=A0ACB8ULY0_9APHY|nr:hypothetical protein BDY19DRAFT_42313 [Irpex rosettiformis]